VFFRSKRVKILDIFCGCGGGSLGFAFAVRDTGLECDIVGIDIDRDACLTFQKNRVGQAIMADARFPPIRMHRGLFDVIIGCPPCQGFTRMRGKPNPDDPRNRLVSTFLEWIKVIRPRYVMFENVPWIHGSNYHQCLEKGLKACGYKYDSKILDAAQFGVPQRRKRFVLVASRGWKPKLPETTHASPVTVREAIGDLPPLGNGMAYQAMPNHRCMRHSKKVLERIKMIPMDGGSRSSLPRELTLPCHWRNKGHSDVYGRLHWDNVAPTLTSGCTNPSKGRFIHPRQNRAITPREAARLQTFSDQFIFHGNFFSVSRQIGNAMPVKFAKHIANPLLQTQ